MGGLRLTCPKCGGEMRLPVRSKAALDASSYTDKGGAKLVCMKCGYTALPSKVRQSNKTK